MVARIEIEQLEADGVVGLCLKVIRDFPAVMFNDDRQHARARHHRVQHDVLPGFHPLTIHRHDAIPFLNA